MLLIAGVLVISVLASTRQASDKHPHGPAALSQPGSPSNGGQPVSAQGAPAVTAPVLSNLDSPDNRMTALDIAGTGSLTTKEFHVEGPWDVAWAYDCGATDGRDLTITPKPASSLPPVRSAGPNGEGVQHYESGGDFQLEVTSQCPWAVRVTD